MSFFDWLWGLVPKSPDGSKKVEISGSIDITKTGYVNPLNPKRLLDICQQVVADPKYKPTLDSTGKLLATHCNEAACTVAMVYAHCNELADANGQPLLCELIYEKFKNSPDKFMKLDTDSAIKYSQNGPLVFGIMSAEELQDGHAHICTCIPGTATFSGHWNRIAPNCMNVGKDNFINKDMAYAFRTIPEFFVIKSTL